MSSGINLAEHWRILLFSPVKWGAMVALAVILTMASAFDSRLVADGWARLGFWLVAILQILLVYGVVGSALVIWRGVKVAESPAAIAFCSVLTGFVVAPIVRLTLVGFGAPWPDMWDLLRAVLEIAIALPLFTLMIEGLCRLYDSSQKPVEESAETTAPIADNIVHTPPIYIETEDHHVKLVFADRVDVQRASLQEMSERWSCCGMRVHRSFWVSFDAIGKRKRVGRQLFLDLENAASIPVGRSYEKAVLAKVRTLADAPA